jgi:hypothetical protein
MISNKPKYAKPPRVLKTFPKALKIKVAGEIKACLHASRDAMRIRGEDTLNNKFYASDAYFSEGFGIMRALKLQRYGYFGSSNIPGLQDGRDDVTSDEQNPLMSRI